MPGATTNVTIDTSIDNFYTIISDFEKYPEFIPEMTNVKILSKTEKSAKIDFALKMFAVSIKYTLEFNFDPPTGVTWNFIKGNKMKDNRGYWKLSPKGNNQVEAEYHAELKLGALIPKKISDTLVNVGLPKLMKQFKERAESIYGK